MKYIFIVLVFICGCLVETGPEPPPGPYYPGPWIDNYDESYCGDGYCDRNVGEDEWWCVDCGYDLYTGGPIDGGYCGDGVCFGDEWWRTCWKDCGNHLN